MTLRNGRYGKRYYRASKDPRGEWAAGPGGPIGRQRMYSTKGW